MTSAKEINPQNNNCLHWPAMFKTASQLMRLGIFPDADDTVQTSEWFSAARVTPAPLCSPLSTRVSGILEGWAIDFPKHSIQRIRSGIIWKIFRRTILIRIRACAFEVCAGRAPSRGEGSASGAATFSASAARGATRVIIQGESWLLLEWFRFHIFLIAADHTAEEICFFLIDVPKDRRKDCVRSRSRSLWETEVFSTNTRREGRPGWREFLPAFVICRCLQKNLKARFCCDIR